MLKLKHLALLVTLACHGGAALAADDARASREREALRRAQAALQSAQQQNADLTRAKADAEAKLKATVDQVGAAQSGAKAAQSRSATLQAELKKTQDAHAALTTRLEDTTKQLSAMTAMQNQTAAQLAVRDGEVTQLNLAVDRGKADIGGCEARNLKLYEYGRSLLSSYKKKGVWDAIQQKEPVTGIKQVEIDNILQEYRDKLDAQKLPVK